MTLKACPQCGYRYNAPENQTCGKCKGWLGGAPASGGFTASSAQNGLWQFSFNATNGMRKAG